MKLYSWNVNGIRAVINKGELQKFVTTHQPDILCLQETKAESHQVAIDLPEYTEFWHSSTGKKGYSGTAIFCKTKPKKVVFGFPSEIAKEYKLTDEQGWPLTGSHFPASIKKDRSKWRWGGYDRSPT